MKFIHIADVHLGAVPDAGTAYSEERPRELWDTFSAVTAQCEREQTDLLLIAGDLFHRQPLLRELKEVNYLFGTLKSTKVVLIAGNHDYIRRDSYYHSFQWSDNVYPLFGREMRSVYLEELDTEVYGLSYYNREIREPLYNGVEPAGSAKYTILLAHGGDEKHIPIRWEALGKSRFDYIALGHIHKPQNVISNKAIYAGSLEPTDKNDVGRHGYIRGEITENGVRTEFVPCAKREYIHLSLQVKESMTNGSVRDWIRQIIKERGVQNLYRFVLQGVRDPDVVFAPESMDFYGNILEVADETKPAFDFQKIWEKNQDNLIGKYIETFSGCVENSLEYQALYEGVQALLENVDICDWLNKGKG